MVGTFYFIQTSWVFFIVLGTFFDDIKKVNQSKNCVFIFIVFIGFKKLSLELVVAYLLNGIVPLEITLLPCVNSNPICTHVDVFIPRQTYYIFTQTKQLGNILLIP